MTATEVINEIKAFNPQERAQILNLLLKLEATQSSSTSDERVFDEAVDHVMTPHADLMRKLAQ